jgi:hypothetical protein
MTVMTDVFVEFERLRQNLEDLRDSLVEAKSDMEPLRNLSAARGNCNQIVVELRSIRSLMSLARERSDELGSTVKKK